jgi:purine nucleoside phosphorylase
MHYFQALRRNKNKTKEAYEKLVQDTVVPEESIAEEINLDSPSTSSDDNMMYRIVEDMLDKEEELASVKQNGNIK